MTRHDLRKCKERTSSSCCGTEGYGELTHGLCSRNKTLTHASWDVQISTVSAPRCETGQASILRRAVILKQGGHYVVEMGLYLFCRCIGCSRVRIYRHCR